jgi:hypothetical protein
MGVYFQVIDTVDQGAADREHRLMMSMPVVVHMIDVWIMDIHAVNVIKGL